MTPMNTAAASSIKIEKGTKFRATIADSNPEWEVTGKAGRGVWRAKCLGEDYHGEIRAFTDAQIRQSLGMARAFARIGDENAAFYAGLTLGAIVHYHNSFGQFVRAEVVMGSTVHDKTPHKCLKPIALVGDWSKHELPHRRTDGSVDMGYNAKCVANGDCFEPNYGCIFESGRPGGRHFDVDPSKLPALDMSVPEMSDEKAAEAKLWIAVKEAQAALTSEDNYSRPARERLEAALKAIQGAL